MLCVPYIVNISTYFNIFFETNKRKNLSIKIENSMLSAFLIPLILGKKKNLPILNDFFFKLQIYKQKQMNRNTCIRFVRGFGVRAVLY